MNPSSGDKSQVCLNAVLRPYPQPAAAMVFAVLVVVVVQIIHRLPYRAYPTGGTALNPSKRKSLASRKTSFQNTHLNRSGVEGLVSHPPKVRRRPQAAPVCRRFGAGSCLEQYGHMLVQRQHAEHVRAQPGPPHTGVLCQYAQYKQMPSVGHFGFRSAFLP